VRVLGGNATSNLYELIEKDKRDAIQYVEYKIARFGRTGDGDKMEKWLRRREKLHRDLEQLNERVGILVSVAPCPICLEKKTEPVLVCCCQNVFCGGCVLKWLQTHDTCPLCRRAITSDRLIYISSSSPPSETLADDNVMEPVLPSKVETILKILQEKMAEKGKVIIFSSFQETFDLIRMTLNENDFRFGEIRGSMAAREKVITEFKEHDLDILFLNSIDSGAGLDLPEATDIILFHPMSESMLTQIRGRAYRIGRCLPLHIHYLR
jgi:SNF2 family DNA or RNA helicase